MIEFKKYFICIDAFHTFINLIFPSINKSKNLNKNEKLIKKIEKEMHSNKHFPILTFFSVIFDPSLWIFYFKIKTSVLFPNFVHKN